LKKYSDLLYKKKLLDKGIHRPYIEEYTKISDVLSYYIQQAIKNEISPSEALTEATKLINSKKFIIK
jgi:multiple sugar transport system substrate-binding protein